MAVGTAGEVGSLVGVNVEVGITVGLVVLLTVEIQVGVDREAGLLAHADRKTVNMIMA